MFVRPKIKEIKRRRENTRPLREMRTQARLLHGLIDTGGSDYERQFSRSECDSTA